MGQVIKKLAAGEEEKKAKEIEPIIEDCYNQLFADSKFEDVADFYHAICDTIEKINEKLGNTQVIRIPSTETLKKEFHKHRPDQKGPGKPLTKEEFGKILQAVIFDTGISGIGVKDMLFYIFGVPTTALVIKQRLIPSVIPNELFIPGITSATVFILAKLNKI